MYLWDERAGALRVLRAEGGRQREAVLWGDGDPVLALGSDGALRRWRAGRDEPELLPWRANRVVRASPERVLAFTADRSLVSVGPNAREGETLTTDLGGAAERSFRPAGAPTGAWAVCSSEQVVLTFRPGWAGPRRYDWGAPVACYYLAMDASGERVWAMAGDAVVGVSLADGARTVLRGHDGHVHTLHASPDGRWVLTGGNDRTARVWDARTGAVAVYAAHEDSVLGLDLSPDGRSLATVSADCSVWVGALDPARALAADPRSLAARVRELTTAVVRADGTLATP